MTGDSTEPRRASPQRAAQARATIEALTLSQDVFETFFEQARIGLALADLSMRFVRVNETYAELVGRRPEDLIGVPFGALGPADAQQQGQIDQVTRGEQPALSSEQLFTGPDGRTRWVLHGVAVVPDADGQPMWFAVSAQDISERRRAEEELRQLTADLAEQAVRDPLTGLANRALLEERLRAALARDARNGTASAVLFLDLDGFKQVNDTHGHAVGDAVLIAVAGRLRQVVRPSDTVARVGGDEFVILLEGAGVSAPVVAEPLVERLQAVVAEPVVVDALELRIGVSVGMSFVVAGDAEPHALLANADAQMYAVKRDRSRRRATRRTEPGVVDPASRPA